MVGGDLTLSYDDMPTLRNSTLQCEFLFAACYNSSNRKSNSNSKHNKNKKHHHQHHQKKKKTQITKPFSPLGFFFRLFFLLEKKTTQKTPKMCFWAGENRQMNVMSMSSSQRMRARRQICGLRESGGMRSPTEDGQIRGKLPNL